MIELIKKKAYKKATWYPLEEGEKIYTAVISNSNFRIYSSEDNLKII